MSRPALVNSPLVEVVYELRFRGDFAVIGGLERIQRALEDEFPSVLVPPAEHGQAIAVQPYRFATADRMESVGVALNSFSFTTKRYTVFDDFRSRVESLLAVLRSVHQPPSFKRLGLRFTNLLPWATGTVDSVHPWVQLGISVPSCLQRPLLEGQSAFLFDFDGNAKLRVTTGKAQQTRELTAGGRHQMMIDSFLLDLDCYREGDIAPDQDVAFLSVAHDIIDAAFFDLLTDAAKAQLEGRE